MSRGIKDLRELIAVSRLSFRDSDEECDESESTDCISTTDDDKPIPSNASCRSSAGGCSDSGIVSTDPSPELISVGDTNSNALSPSDKLFTTSISNSLSLNQKKKKKRNNKFRQNRNISTVPEISPSSSVLPPIHPNVSKRNNSNTEPETDSSKVESNFDYLMVYIDVNVVSEWLKRANAVLQEMSSWIHQNENFVHFANFWLTAFSEPQKKEIFELEYGVLIDEIGLAFKSGKDTRAVDIKDFSLLAQAVFREYPGRLLGERGPYMFLDYLDILTSERTDEYRRVLTDVKLSTKNKTYAQWFLALRSFGLVNIWSAIISFYRELLFRGHVMIPPPNTAHKQKRRDSSESSWIRRTHMAINYNSVKVLHYIITTKKINPKTLRDSDKRNLVFQAVSSQKPEILMYLIKEVHPLLDVNSPSDTGNTPLHAAACSGNLQLVKILIEAGKAEVNPLNENCENSSPLHMAVMYGHCNIVKYLLSKGANIKLKMNGVDSRQLAKDFEQTECLRIMDDYLSQKKAPASNS